MLKFFSGRPNEHVSHEQRVVGSCTNDPYPNPVPLVPTGISVNDIDTIPSIQVVNSSFPVNLPYLNVQGISISMCAKRFNHNKKGL